MAEIDFTAFGGTKFDDHEMEVMRRNRQDRPVYFRDIPNVDGDFSDNRVILIPPGDFDKDPTSCIAGQDYDGPTFVTIGPNATDSSLAQVSKRYGIPSSDLHEFRTNLIASGAHKAGLQ